MTTLGWQRDDARVRRPCCAEVSARLRGGAVPNSMMAFRYPPVEGCRSPECFTWVTTIRDKATSQSMVFVGPHAERFSELGIQVEVALRFGRGGRLPPLT
jgi:hypothetical protein